MIPHLFFSSAANTLKSNFPVVSLVVPMSELYLACIMFNPVLVYLLAVRESRVGGILNRYLQKTATPFGKERFSIAPLNLSDASL